LLPLAFAKLFANIRSINLYQGLVGLVVKSPSDQPSNHGFKSRKIFLATALSIMCLIWLLQTRFHLQEDETAFRFEFIHLFIHLFIHSFINAFIIVELLVSKYITMLVIMNGKFGGNHFTLYNFLFCFNLFIVWLFYSLFGFNLFIVFFNIFIVWLYSIHCLV